MSTSFISDIIKFIKNGFYLDINDAKSYLSIFIIKFININLAPIAVLIQLINSGRFNSMLLFNIGVLIILIINIIITSQSFINLIIKIENSIINLFFVFNNVFNLLQRQREGSNINISNIKHKMSTNSTLKSRLGKAEQNKQHKYSYSHLFNNNLNKRLLNQFKINQMKFGRDFSTSNINLNHKDIILNSNSKDNDINKDQNIIIKDDILSTNSNHHSDQAIIRKLLKIYKIFLGLLLLLLFFYFEIED